MVGYWSKVVHAVTYHRTASNVADISPNTIFLVESAVYTSTSTWR